MYENGLPMVVSDTGFGGNSGFDRGIRKSGGNKRVEQRDHQCYERDNDEYGAEQTDRQRKK